MNKKILFLTNLDVLAHTGRCLLIANELNKKKIKVFFAGNGRYCFLVKKNKFELYNIPEILTDEIVKNSEKGRKWPLTSVSKIDSLVRADLSVISKIKPDLIVFDHRYITSISCRIAKIPSVSVTNIWWTNYSKIKIGLPETHPIFLNFKQLRLLKNLPFLENVGNKLTKVLFKKWARPYTQVCKIHRVVGINHIYDLFVGDKVLLPDMELMAPSSNLPKNYHHIGPLVWEPNKKMPENLKKMKNYIYVSMGSSADPKIFDVIIGVARNLKKERFVITLGKSRKKEDFKNLPENVYLYDFLKGSDLVEKSKLVVCHGGIGTIYQALSFGKPILAVPFTVEQEVYGADRVNDLKVGLKVSSQSINPSKLSNAIMVLLSDKKYGENAKKLSKDIDLKTAPKIAARIIEDRLFWSRKK